MKDIEIVTGLRASELACRCEEEMCEDSGTFNERAMEFLQRVSDVRSMMGIRMKVTSFWRPIGYAI